MARMLAEPRVISVRFEDRSPIAVKTDGGSYEVTCPSAWRETGEWWAGETEKDFYRVHSTRCGFAAVIGRCRETRDWHLYQLAD